MALSSRKSNKFSKLILWLVLIPVFMAVGYYAAATFDPDPLATSMPVAPIVADPVPEAPSPLPQDADAAAVSVPDAPAPLEVPQPPADEAGLAAAVPPSPLDEARKLANNFMIAKDQRSKNDTYEKALSAFDKLVAAEPDNIDALLGRAELKDMWVPLSGRMDYEAVRDKLTPKLDQSPNDVALLRQRAKAYKGIRQLDLAKADMEAAIEANPNDPALKAEMQRLVDDKPFGL